MTLSTDLSDEPEIFHHITLPFTKFLVAFYDVLLCVLRYIALHFTILQEVKQRETRCVSIWNWLRFYIETHAKLDVLPSLHRHYRSVKLVGKILIFITLTLRHQYFQKVLGARTHVYIIYIEKQTTQLERSYRS